jgi:hypothetical protein
LIGTLTRGAGVLTRGAGAGALTRGAGVLVRGAGEGALTRGDGEEPLAELVRGAFVLAELLDGDDGRFTALLLLAAAGLETAGLPAPLGVRPSEAAGVRTAELFTAVDGREGFTGAVVREVLMGFSAFGGRFAVLGLVREGEEARRAGFVTLLAGVVPRLPGRLANAGLLIWPDPGVEWLTWGDPPGEAWLAAAAPFPAVGCVIEVLVPPRPAAPAPAAEPAPGVRAMPAAVCVPAALAVGFATRTVPAVRAAEGGSAVLVNTCRLLVAGGRLACRVLPRRAALLGLSLTPLTGRSRVATPCGTRAEAPTWPPPANTMWFTATT